MLSYIDVLLIGGALIGLAGVMGVLIMRPGRKHHAEMLTIVSRPRDPADGNTKTVSALAQTAPDYSVFISYRRNDSADIVGRLHEHLTGELGDKAVYTDVDSMVPGHDFRIQLEKSLETCRVLLCVIGDQWAGPAGSPDRLIDRPGDFVRIEIETGLRRNIPIIPVLVRGLRMPPPEFFPESLKEVAFRQGLPLRSDPDFRNDVRRLLASVRANVFLPQQDVQASLPASP